MKTVKSELIARISVAVDHDNPPKGLVGKSVAQLTGIIKTAVKEFSLPDSWGRDFGTDEESLIEYIDEMCNEFSLQVGDGGDLVKPAA